jgi:histone deacetylase complex regulatory component SIN3
LETEKRNRTPEWMATCAQNFSKSLDNRSFFFKDAQRKLLQPKKQFDELKKLLSNSKKNDF